MKTVVMVNTLTSVQCWAYSSHCQEWFRMGKDFPDDDFILHTPFRTSIDRARNQAVEIALSTDADYVYFIDDDMVLSPHTYRSLRGCKADIAMAHSVIRGYPYQNMHFIDPEDKDFTTDRKVAKSLILWDDYEPYVTPEGTLRVDAVGCATVLYKTSLFKEMEPPYFVTLPNMTEDVYFNLKLQEKYGRQNIKAVVDLKVPTGHILYAEVAMPHDRKTLQEWDEKRNPALKAQSKQDRSEEYKSWVEDAFDVKA